MTTNTNQTQAQIPVAPVQSQPIQGGSTTQLILSLALLIKAIALLIHTLKR